MSEQIPPVVDLEEISEHEDSDSTSESGGDPKRKKMSAIYEHYKFLEDDARYKCKYCSTSYPKRKDGSTSVLRKHITQKHPKKLPGGVMPTAMQTYIAKGHFRERTEEFTPSGLLKKVVKFIVIHDEPFSTVEMKEFRDLLLYCNPQAAMPCATTIRKEITKCYEDEKEKLRKMLQETPGKISFAIDGWTSKNQWPFLGVVANWINSEWELNTLVVDLVKLDGPHTGANIAQAFFDVFETFEIVQKLHTITTDNAGNMDTFVSSFANIMKTKGHHFDKENNHVRCMAHIINLCCRAAIESLERESVMLGSSVQELEGDSDVSEIVGGKKDGVIAKLRQSIAKIRASPQRREVFRRQCEVANMEQLELILDVETRWNSTYDMIVRASKLREPLECSLRGDRQLILLVLTENEWNMLAYLKDFLEPFKDVTVFTSSEAFPTISYCAMVYSTLYAHLESYMVHAGRNLKGIDPETNEVYPKWLQNAAGAAFDKLTKYYPSSDRMAYVIATVLDPRCKLEWYKIEKFRPDIIQKYRRYTQAYFFNIGYLNVQFEIYFRSIKSIWDNNYKPSVGVVQAADQSSSAEKKQSLFAKNLSKIFEADTTDELDRYLTEMVVSTNLILSGAVGWWKNHTEEYPNLSKMARDYLSSSGTGVPCERLFSCGPDLLSNRRQSLSSEKIEQCICLKGWMMFNDKESHSSSVTQAIVDKMLGNVS